MSKALQDASPNEWIEFASTVQSRDSVDPVPLLTDGYVFKKDGRLNVVLRNLKTENTKNNRPMSGDPRERFSLEFKRINLADGITAPPVIPGSRFLKQPHDNWAVIDIPSILSPKKETQVTTEAPARVERQDVVDRMKLLKELFDEGLITKEEYKKKKEEILNEI